MSKPTFMKTTKVSEDGAFLHYVDRREGSPTEFWNFFYEGYDVSEKGEEYYVEGMLALHNGVCEDFDGSFDLPDDVVVILSQMGYDCPWR